jgi:hypothetical protein
MSQHEAPIQRPGDGSINSLIVMQKPCSCGAVCPPLGGSRGDHEGPSAEDGRCARAGSAKRRHRRAAAQRVRVQPFRKRCSGLTFRGWL